MADAYTESAVAAALAVATRLGLRTDSPEVLHARSNVLVRLGPVVARVPATTRLARPEPAPWLARDVALSRHLTERGVPVVSPLTDPPAGPHFAAGLPVTLWHWTPHDPDHGYGPDVVAESLARVHAGLRDYSGELPAGGPVEDLRRVFSLHGAAFGEKLPALRAETDRIAAALPAGPVQALHGDAHARNLIATEAGPCWLDFEDTWRGPLAWDLATLAVNTSYEAFAAYPTSVDDTAFKTCVELRRLFGVVWQHVIALREPERLPRAQAAFDDYFS